MEPQGGEDRGSSCPFPSRPHEVRLAYLATNFPEDPLYSYESILPLS